MPVAPWTAGLGSEGAGANAHLDCPGSSDWSNRHTGHSTGSTGSDSGSTAAIVVHTAERERERGDWAVNLSRTSCTVTNKKLGDSN